MSMVQQLLSFIGAVGADIRRIESLATRSVSPATALKIYKAPSASLIPAFPSANPVTANGVTYTVSASSSFNASYAPWMAFDGSFNTNNWATASQTTNFWIQVQMSVAKVFDSFEIGGRYDSSPEYPTGLIWQGSNNGTTWTDIVNLTTLPTMYLVGTNSTTKLICTTNTTAYSYYRWYFPTSTGINPGLGVIKAFNLASSPGSEVDQSALISCGDRLYFNAPFALSAAHFNFGINCWNNGAASTAINYGVYSGLIGTTKVSEGKLFIPNATWTHSQVFAPIRMSNLSAGNYPLNFGVLNTNTVIESNGGGNFQYVGPAIGISM